MGGGKRTLEYVLESLNAQRGTAYDITEDSAVYAENMAYARALAEVLSMNQRLANQWIPSKMTTCLARWEAICGIRPAPTDTDAVRRARIAQKFDFIGKLANRAKLDEELAAELGSVFVAVEYISYANAIIHVPDGTYPWGTVSSGAPWCSTVAHVLIKTQVPTGYTEEDYYAAVARVSPLMEQLAPAWVTWDWYRAPASGTPVSVSGGPSAGGFYLDDEHNLDNNVFDV